MTIAIIREDKIGDKLTNMIAMDLPGRYPITSADGHKYIFIMLDLDSDYIKGVAMKSRKTSEMIRCYSICYNYFKAAGFTAQLLQLDNEVSQQLIKHIEDDKLDYQLVAPGDHQRNLTEREIQDYKIILFQC